MRGFPLVTAATSDDEMTGAQQERGPRDPTTDESRTMRLSSATRPTRWVAVGLVALLVAVAGVVAWGYVQRQQQEARMEAFEAIGLLTVSVPELPPYRMAHVQSLDEDLGQGLRITYTLDGDSVADMEVLQVNAPVSRDLCEVLIAAEPRLAAGECTSSGNDVSASVQGEEGLVAEGHRYAQTLAVVVAHPDIYSVQELQVRIGITRMMTVRELVERIDN